MKAKWFVWMLLLPMHVSAQQYVAINLPASLGTGFYVAGINPSGTEIVGTYYDGAKTDGVRLSKGTFSTLAFPAVGATDDSSAAGVNDSGAVVGACTQINPYKPDAPQYGLTYNSDGAYAIYVAPGPKMTWFSAINNQGVSVGYYQNWNCDGMGCARRGFRLTNGSLSTLEFPGAMNTTATGINNLGEIVGNYEDAAGWHGFTWSRGAYREFSTVSGATLAGINDSGDIAGVHSSGSFVLSGGMVHAISFPGSTYTSVSGIANRKGGSVEVVGNYMDGNGNPHGFYAVVGLR